MAEAKALACLLPAETGAPMTRWSCPDLARELAARGITGPVSASTVRRRLAEDALKPGRHRSWIFITAPDFRAKAQRVLHLYARTWQGKALGEDQYVISADEKTSIQAARHRCGLPQSGERGADRQHHQHERDVERHRGDERFEPPTAPVRPLVRGDVRERGGDAAGNEGDQHSDGANPKDEGPNQRGDEPVHEHQPVPGPGPGPARNGEASSRKHACRARRSGDSRPCVLVVVRMRTLTVALDLDSGSPLQFRG
ncbi:hypothetical protein ACH4MM_32160 [Streptomyces pratensis]|uniref:hypothetical protein n=1 Tax=Streptomyces pratensis TaxID=1169025 RepID=UPI0037B14410